jgi:crotonobetainyl-CoA:carnitine CoA-transferase CaiB-like acyl-CoA transferase
MTDAAAGGRPLDDVLVADFSRVLAGPLATMALADLGATVVKVERPGAGDDTRNWGPPWSSTGASTYFESANRGKHSVTLDLSDSADLALARELAGRADVLVENFKPGTMARLGLGYEDVSSANPGVVYCSVTGFGSDGGAGLLGYDFLVQAVGGLMSITGEETGDRTKVGVAVVDVLTGKDATIGILAALAARSRTGEGCRLEVSLLSSLLGSLVNQAQAFLAAGTVPGRMGNRHPSIVPYETLHCRDGLLAVACGNDGQFARLAAALGAPDLAQDPRFATNTARVAHRHDVVARLESLLAADDAKAWESRLTAAGVPAGRVGDIASAFELAHRLGLRPHAEPVGGGSPQVRHSVTYSRDYVAEPVAPPPLGAHDGGIRSWLSGPAEAPPPPLSPRTPQTLTPDPDTEAHPGEAPP